MIKVVLLRLLFLACITQYVRGENKRLVCKTAGTDFAEDYSEVQTKTNGSNYFVLDAAIETITDRVIKRMQTMEERIFNKLHTTLFESTDLKGLQDAIIYKGRKFWAVLHSDSYTNYEEAEMLCKQRGGRPADILEDNDIKVINEHVIATISKHTDAVDVWLGMKFDYVTKEVKYFDGDTAPEFRWFPGHPTSNRFTHIALEIQRDQSSKRQGLFIDIYTSKLHGVVCQK